jgi:6-phosphogluconolactonase (cycloisomerase 2 family)
MRSRTRFTAICLVLAALPQGASAYLRVQELTEGTDAAFPDVTSGSNARPTLAPDGRTLYIAGGSDDSLMAMTRDPVTGHVGDVVDVERDGANGVDGLRGARDALVSPDNRFIYVAGGDEAAVAVFERTATPNLLTHRETQIDGIAGVDDLLGPLQPVFSPGATHLYVPARNSGAIAVFARESDGTLEFLESEALGVNSQPVSAAVSSDGRFLYAAEPLLDRMAIVSRDVATGALAYLGEEDLGVNVTDVEFASLDRVVAAACCAISMNDVLSIYARDAATGAILVPQAGGATLQRFDATHRTASAREHIYVLESEQGEAPLLEVFSEPLLDRLESQQDGFASANVLDGADAVAPSPDGAHLYVASGTHDAISVFARNAQSGALVWVETVSDAASPCPLDGPTSIAVSDDGSGVFTTASISDSLCRFYRDAATGALTFDGFAAGAAQNLLGADDVALSPDGRNVYVAAVGSDAIAQYSRDPVTGDLTPLGAVTDDVGLDSLASAAGIVVSRDGRFAYSVSFASDAIAVLSRDAATGALTLIDEVVSDVSHPILGPRALELAHGSLLVAIESGVAVLRRDPADGHLGYAQSAISSAGSYTAYDVAVSPDGRSTYATAFADDRVEVYAPEPEAALLAVAALIALTSMRSRVRVAEPASDPMDDRSDAR